MKTTVSAVILLFIFLLNSQDATASTNVCGAITANTTWTASGDATYIVTCNVTVNLGKTLTINPGVIVKFAANTELQIKGKLTANGTSGNLITFTSNLPSPAPGDWRTIRFRPGSNSTSQISYATVSYGGSSTYNTSIDIASVSPTLSNITISNSGGNGIQISGSSSTSNLTNVTITDSDENGIYITSADPTLSNVTISNSGISGMFVGSSASISMSNVSVTNSDDVGIWLDGPNVTLIGGTVSDNVLWGIWLTSGATLNISSSTLNNNTDYPIMCSDGTRVLGLTSMTMSGNDGGNKDAVGYEGRNIATAEVFGPVTWDVIGNIYVEQTGILTVSADGTVRFFGGSLEIAGKLTAVGTSADPIQFTSSSDNPVPGNWAGILFWPESDDTSELSYVTISYAGTGSWWSSAMLIFDASPTLDHVTTSNSSTHGIEIWGAPSNPSMTNLTFTNNADFGLMITEFVEVTVSDSTFTGNEVGIRIDRGSPTLNNITVTGSTDSGIDISGIEANPVMSNIQLSANGDFGVEVWGEGGMTLTDSTISNNTNYAIRAEANTRLLGLTGLTLTGNGGGSKDAIGYWGGGISTNEVWRDGPDWVMAGDPWVDNGGELIIEPGVTVKFPGNGFSVNGKLTAVGTDANPITFTSNQQTPAAGDWGGIVFWPSSNPQSKIAYATLAYGGNSWPSGIYIDSSTPTLDHVTISNSASEAVTLVGTAAPVIKNCSFINNVQGIYNENPSNTVTATLNYWGSADGPSGQGSGTGQWVSTGVVFSPWLVSVPSYPHYFTSVTVSNFSFDPTLGESSAFDFQIELSGNWSISIFNDDDEEIRSFSGTGTAGTAVWNGTDSGGVLQQPTDYRFELSSTTAGSDVASRVTGIITLDYQSLIPTFNINPSYFSPNGDLVQDTTTISATFTSTANWTLLIKNSSNSTVASTNGSGTSFSYVWNGSSQQDGIYTANLSATIGSFLVNDSRTVTLDNTLPTAVITSPVPGTISNVYQNGGPEPIIGTASDLNINNWQLEYGIGASPSSWIIIATGSSNITNNTIAQWSTLALTNGTYTLRLKVFDKAGNVSTSTPVTVTVSNFKLTQDKLQINTSTGESLTYTSSVPFTLTEILLIKDMSGQTVKTLFNGTRNAGSHNDVWSGLNEAGSALVADGAYKVIVNIQSGPHSMTWDQSAEFVSTVDELHYPTIVGNDPFNNEPRKFVSNYPIQSPGKVRITCSPDFIQCGPPGSYCVIANDDCSGTTVCLIQDEYFPTGTFEIPWAATDNYGVFRNDLRGCTMFRKANSFSKNNVLLFGRQPKITNLAVSPPLYGPEKGNQSISFTLTTFESQQATITITILNQSSVSVLRNIVVNNVNPGTVNIQWDGRADNGMWVAPGNYTVNVIASTPVGQSRKTQILTTIKY